MKREDFERRYGVLRERTSRLTAATLRVNASLDHDTVLRRIVDGARALTGARYGIVAVVDHDGRPSGHLMSGFTDSQASQLLEWGDAMALFEHFRDLPSPLRERDLPAYVRSLGSDWVLPLPCKTFQATPIRHCGTLVGSLFLAGKAGGNFTAEDEEILVLFASQAAVALVNARTHRAEQRVRADLEALVETSPVGVVVFDPASGRPVSLNREASRIVDRLRTPDREREDILDALVYRRADGREIALHEFPGAAGPNSGETIPAEEIEFSVPGGPSVSALVTATAIPANHPANDDNGIESVVMTMQDLEPLRELERQRAHFIGMVSHELRVPLAAIKGSATTVLDGGENLDAAEVLQFFRIIDAQADRMRSLIRDLLDARRVETGTLSVEPESADLAALVDEARNTFARGGGRHLLHIDLPLDLPFVAADPPRILQVLDNLLANAARHAPESTAIRITAAREGTHVSITVADDGEGVPPELLARLFSKHPGSADTSMRVGTGLGLPICRGIVEAHGGRIRAESAGPGRGTAVTFTLPATEDAAHAARTREADPPSPNSADPVPVVVVDDDPIALRHMRDALKDAGYAPTVTGDPRELEELVRSKRPRLVVLDLMLPSTDGFELMATIPDLEDIPVIFVSGYGRDEAISEALEAGAVDYIVKPFSATELVARSRAALRRHAGPEPFVSGELAIYFDARQVFVAGRPIGLTATEFDLLRTLALNAGRVCTYDALLRRVWAGRDTGSNDLVRTFIRKLRRKLGDDPALPEWILNERAVGYRMVAPGKG